MSAAESAVHYALVKEYALHKYKYIHNLHISKNIARVQLATHLPNSMPRHTVQCTYMKYNAQ